MAEWRESTDGEEIAIGLSTEELVVLAELLGQRELPGLGAEPLGPVESDSRASAVRAALHGLLARRIVRIDDGDATVLDAIATLLSIASAPAIFAHVLYETAGLVESRMYAAQPEISVEHALLGSEVHRLSPFPTDQLLARLLSFCQLEERPEIACTPFDVSAGVLRACGRAISAGDASAAISTMVDDGAETGSATAFVNALVTKRSSTRVALVYRPREHQLAGGELTWVDGGDHGLWLTPTPPHAPQAEEDAVGASEPTSILIQPTSARWVATELLSYLPGSDDSAAAAGGQVVGGSSSA
jgi:hypothetical protein